MRVSRQNAWSLASFAAIASALSCSSASPPGPVASGATDAGADSGSVADAALASDTADDVAAPVDDTGSAPTTDTAPPADTGAATADYPAGPYGRSTGAVLADLTMDGYLHFDPAAGLTTDATFETVRLSDLRAKATAPYALIHEVGFF